MSYIEQGVYWYAKRVLFSGFKNLTERKWLAITLFTASLIVLSTLSYLGYFSLDSKIQTAIATGFVLSAIWLMRGRVFVFAFISLSAVLFLLNYQYENLLLSLLYLGWIALINIVSFLVIKDFISGWGGFVLLLGNRKGRVVFNPVISLIAALVIFYSVYSSALDMYIKAAAIAVSLLIIFIVNVYSRRANYNVFGAIAGFYFLSTAYHLYFSNNFVNYSLAVDAIVVIFNILFATNGLIIGLPNHTKNKNFSMMLMLGLLLGYHNAILKMNLVETAIQSYHNFSFIISSWIISVIVIAFMQSERFRIYMTQRKEMKTIGKKVLDFAIKKLFSNI